MIKQHGRTSTTSFLLISMVFTSFSRFIPAFPMSSMRKRRTQVLFGHMNTTERLLRAGAQAQVTNKMGDWDGVWWAQ